MSRSVTPFIQSVSVIISVALSIASMSILVYLHYIPAAPTSPAPYFLYFGSLPSYNYSVLGIGSFESGNSFIQYSSTISDGNAFGGISGLFVNSGQFFSKTNLNSIIPFVVSGGGTLTLSISNSSFDYPTLKLGSNRTFTNGLSEYFKLLKISLYNYLDNRIEEYNITNELKNISFNLPSAGVYKLNLTFYLNATLAFCTSNTSSIHLLIFPDSSIQNVSSTYLIEPTNDNSVLLFSGLSNPLSANPSSIFYPIYTVSGDLTFKGKGYAELEDYMIGLIRSSVYLPPSYIYNINSECRYFG